MNFKKSMLFVAAIAFMGFQANAQTDVKAKAILDGLSKKINSLKTMKANFNLKLVSANGKTNQSKSGIIYMKGPKYQVNMGAQSIYCDNATVWTYMKDANEVQVSKYNPSEQTISPSKLFTNFVDKEYKYKFMGEKKMNGKTTNLVELTPVAAGKQFKKVELYVDKATNMVVAGNVLDKSGSKYVYTISGFTPNPPLADSYFTFDKKKFPGVEVVDLR